MKCANCEKEGQAMIEITNYVVTYESWEAYNCCCEECAQRIACSDLGIQEGDIRSIE